VLAFLVLIEASNGASDYGNKFGEPVIGGYCRSFGMRVGNERIEYIKVLCMLDLLSSRLRCKQFIEVQIQTHAFLQQPINGRFS
jgi:hypothetical protein